MIVGSVLLRNWVNRVIPKGNTRLQLATVNEGTDNAGRTDERVNVIPPVEKLFGVSWSGRKGRVVYHLLTTKPTVRRTTVIFQWFCGGPGFSNMEKQTRRSGLPR